MKKYICVGILIGAIALVGCSVNRESEKKVTEDITNGQAVEVGAVSDTHKEKVVLVTPLELTQEQKEEYHKQYVEIVEKINAEEGTIQLEVVPIDEFKTEDWVEPEKFRQLAVDRAHSEFTSKVFGGDPVE
ncbi:hypothetical protein [Lederbergia citrea]|uniref:hypothetical protein n=1 Tax=Lederbergia citrea TaxID=2833581 RepID=UPI001BCA5C55|nr:hypothetical protein [Lederbergia citrea]MBS4203440.1 hypothetical protein [Lederbergia citrea]